MPFLKIFEVLNALYYKKLFTTEELKNASRALEAYGFKSRHLNGDYAAQVVDIAL